MINWQPIATFSLEYTYVLIYDGFDVWKAVKKDGKWYCDSCNEDHETLLWHEPTHWLPISDLLQPLGHL